MENNSQPTVNPASQTPTMPEQTPPQPKKSLISNKPFLIFLIILIFIVASSVSLMFYTSRNIVTDNFNIIPTISPSPTPTPDPTANWKTYENSELNYSFKYPSNWSLAPQINNDCAPSVFLIPPNGSLSKCTSEYGDIIAVGYVLPPDVSMQNAIMTSQDEFGLKKIDTYVDSKKSIKVFGTGRTTNVNLRHDINLTYKIIQYYIPANNKVFILSYDVSTKSVDYSRDFEKIVSTFKFTETSPTPTCKPRPACLDATPRCLIPETSDMCPPTVTPQIKAGKS